jgi:hypothetical protein
VSVAPARPNLPRYYGKWRGLVVQVDEQQDDTEAMRQQRGRVRVMVPALFGSRMLLDWALPCYALAGGRTPDPTRAGEERGLFYIPSPGDMVWVEFEQGDMRKPIWTGGFFPERTDKTTGIPRLARGEDDGTSGATELDPNHTYAVGPAGAGADFVRAQANPPAADPTGTDYAAKYPWNLVFKSKSGITIELDDTKGATRIRVRHPSGSQVQFRHNGDIKIFAARDYIVAAHNRIILKAPEVLTGAGDLMGEVLTKLTQPACMVTGIPFGFSRSVKANS